MDFEKNSDILRIRMTLDEMVKQRGELPFSPEELIENIEKQDQKEKINLQNPMTTKI